MNNGGGNSNNSNNNNSNGGGGGGGRGRRRRGNRRGNSKGPDAKRGRGNDGHDQKQAPQQQKQQQAEPVSKATGSGARVSTLHLSDQRFADQPISAPSRRALAEVLGYEMMTQVQAQTLPTLLKGRDVLAKAKTGTGKTLAFLIPAIEQIVARPPQATDVSVLVVSPTRELATQIGTEAKAMLRFQPDIKVHVSFGGTNVRADRNRINGRCDILIVTPGRFEDHLENCAGLKARLQRGLRTLILDECDQLLDMGFRPAVERIIRALPRQRQAMLFSATVPASVHEVASMVLNKAQSDFIDTVGEEDETNAQVEQHFALVEMEQQFAVVAQLIENHIQQEPDTYKIICFFTTARLTQYFAELLHAYGRPVLEIHSRKSQSHRTKVSAQFRDATKVVMMSSDVSARGLDYPDISMVLQVGVPADAQQYVHRLGRTARAGRAGFGVLVLSPDEQYFLRDRAIRELPLEKIDGINVTEDVAARMANGVQRVVRKTVSMAYQAWLGYYNSQSKLRWSKPQLVEQANRFARVMGHQGEPPALQARTVGKMGLKGVPGLNVERGGGGGGGGGGGRRGGGGGGRGRGGGGGGGGRGRGGGGGGRGGGRW